MERELKLLLDPAAVHALRRHPLLEEYASAPPRSHTLHATYYDTPSLYLQRHAANLRVRRQDSDWQQTFKAGDRIEAGLAVRHEWETPLHNATPDLALLRAAAGKKSLCASLLVKTGLQKQLRPVFTSAVERTVWSLRLPQGDEVELALDVGALQAGGREATVCEIELELQSGDPLHLFDFALLLAKDLPLQISSQSKAARGYALAGDAPHTPVKAEALRLSRGMQIEQACSAILKNCLHQVEANRAGIAEGYDGEHVHQMRVGLRRLRSGLGLFKDLLTLPEALQQELDWLGEQLGAARDWDVLAESTLGTVRRALPQEARIAQVKISALGKSEEMHRHVESAVRSARYTRLVLRFGRWLEGRDWRTDMTPDQLQQLHQGLARFADAVLEQDQKRLQKRGRKLRDAEVASRHRVRIAAKKSRYATEFFRSLYPARRVKNYVAALSGLQDELGRLNDVAVAERLLSALQDEDSELEASACFVRGYLASFSQAEQKTVLKLWKKFTPVKLPC